MSDMSKLQTGFAEIEGARLYYEMAGEGRNLILVHAGIADRRMWDNQFTIFALQYRVIRYDMRGFGNSPMSSGPFSHRQDLYHFLNFLNIKQAHFIGCSMGGLTIIDFALEHPEMITSLVLVSASVSGFQFRGEPPSPVLELITARQEGDFNRAAELQVQIWADGFRRASGQADASMSERVRQMSLDALVNQANFLKQTGFVTEEPLTPPALERLGRLSIPTMVMVGELDDESVATVADVLTAHIPGARKDIIPGAAHLPNMEKPKEFNQMVLEFLQHVSALKK